MCGVVAAHMTVACVGNLCVHGVCLSSWCGVVVGATYTGDCVYICYKLLYIIRKSHCWAPMKGFTGCLT